MLVTADVSQVPIGLLNLRALWNMKLISVTADVFQDPMDSLKVWRNESSPDISVILEVSHSEMPP